MFKFKFIYFKYVFIVLKKCKCMQNGKEIIMFSDIEIKKQKFHSHKIPISIDDVNIDRTAVSNKVPSSKKGFKYFIRYEDDYEKVMPCVLLQQ